MNVDAVKSFFNTRAEHWDETCFHDVNVIETLLDLCRIRPGDKVLDVACGTGILTRFLLARGAEILGVDFAEEMILRAKQNHQDPRVRFAAQDVFSVTEEEFDLVIVYSAFPHFPDRAALFSHLKDRLKSGGRIVICHSESRAEIDRRHRGAASEISLSLPPAEELKQTLSFYFTPETAVENDTYYFVSALKA